MQGIDSLLNQDRSNRLPARYDPAERSLGSAVTLIANRRIGRYRLCFELARGGMASVHLSRVDDRAGFHRFVALKQIHPHLAGDPAFVEMFLDEAHIASRISHANVCSVFDFGVEDGCHFMAMEFLTGEPLSRVAAAMARGQGPADPARQAGLVCRVLADVCEGLHAAHELCDPQGEPLGVVHRDVSPPNLFLTFDGVVKVVDFGVARVEGGVHGRTKTGVIKGRCAYVAPEVLGGALPDRRSDVWGAGVVLWELLTGRRLFRREGESATLLAVCNAAVPPPSDVRPGLPEGLDDVVLRALVRDPAGRYATTRDLGRDLMAFSACAGSRGGPVGLADLAEWMDQLFPGGRACKRQLLEIAAQIDAAATRYAGRKTAAAEAPERDGEGSSADEAAPPPAKKRRSDGKGAPRAEAVSASGTKPSPRDEERAAPPADEGSVDVVIDASSPSLGWASVSCAAETVPASCAEWSRASRAPAPPAATQGSTQAPPAEPTPVPFATSAAAPWRLGLRGIAVAVVLSSVIATVASQVVPRRLFGSSPPGRSAPADREDDRRRSIPVQIGAQRYVLDVEASEGAPPRVLSLEPAP